MTAGYIVIAAPDQVRGFSTGNPWIPERVRDDNHTVRDDTCRGSDKALPERNPAGRA